MLRFLTAGESHGPRLTVIIDGFPAGFSLDLEKLNHQLMRRQKGYGRGGRMKIEADKVDIISGVRHGRTLGSPVTLVIENRDWENWRQVMAPFGSEPSTALSAPRPGHADLAGAIKYRHDDIRNVLERASARETAVRTAAGVLARQLLEHFGISLASHVIQIGQVRVSGECDRSDLGALAQRAEESLVRCLDEKMESKMTAAIDQAAVDGDSLGGIAEVIVRGLPVGLGSYTQWDRRMDTRLAAALMSIPSIKGVEIGAGFAGSGLTGTQYHDAIIRDPNAGRATKGFRRPRNNAGGIEGGITNGEDVISRVAAKPLPTLARPLPTVDLTTMEATKALTERSDVCVLPAVAVISEAVAALVFADAFLEKFGGDNIVETERAYRGFLDDNL